MATAQSADSLCLIGARGGSKRLPGKNVKQLLGKPLIAWTVEAALESGCFDRVWVSTDDEVIAGAAARYGAEAPFLRPAAIASDTSPVSELIAHALDYHLRGLGRKPSWFALLQPTSPLRTAEHIRRAVDSFQTSGAPTLASFTTVHPLKEWLFEDGDDPTPIAGWDGIFAGRTRLIAPNGSIFVARTEAYEAEPTFYRPGMAFFRMSQVDSVDIDTAEDFALAERLLEAGNA